MNLHPQPLCEPIPVKALIPRSLGTRSQRINPWITANEPAATICRTAAGYELKEAQIKLMYSFPESFRLEGSFAEKWARIGNSIPPLFMKAIAEYIFCRVLKRAR
jgi:site-specific DNA-cytosine methylase